MYQQREFTYRHLVFGVILFAFIVLCPAFLTALLWEPSSTSTNLGRNEVLSLIAVLGTLTSFLAGFFAIRLFDLFSGR